MTSKAPILTLSAAVLAAAACDSILGLDEFAGATLAHGGAGGAAGSSSTAGAGGVVGGGGAGGAGNTADAHLWSRRYGDIGDERADGIALTSDGIVIAGDFSGTTQFGGQVIEATDDLGTDAYIVKLAADGAHLWTKLVTGTHEEVMRSVATDGDDRVFAGLFYRSDIVAPGGASWGAWGAEEPFFMQLAASGDYDWGERPKCNGANQRVTGVVAAPALAAGVLVTGYFGGEITLGPNAFATETSTHNVFLAHFGLAGQHQWSVELGEDGYQQPLDIAVLADGRSAIVGACSGWITGAVPCGAGAHPNAFVAVHAETGAFEWAAGYGDTGSAVAHGVAAHGAGMVVVGEFASTIDFGGATQGPHGAAGDQDIFLVKLDGTGGALWSHSFGGLDKDAAYDVAVDSLDQIVVTGVMRGTVDFGDGEHHGVDGDVFVLVLDAEGNTLRSARYGNNEDQEGRAVAVGPDGTITIHGNMHGSIDFGGGELSSTGSSQDTFVVQLAPGLVPPVESW